VAAIAEALGRRPLIVPMPPRLGYLLGRLLGRLLGDVLITREEIAGLMGDLLYVDSPPAGRTRLTDWLARNRAALGRRYASELRRRRDRRAAYLPA
jgi:NADH dehydrogenase